MSSPDASVLLFQRALHGWVLLYLLTALPAMDMLWIEPISPQLPYAGWRFDLVHPFGRILSPTVAPWVLVLALGLSLRGLFKPSRWWSALLLWVCFNGLMHLAFMASSGGQQLMANMLFWNIPLSMGRNGGRAVLHGAAFWIIRLQLLLAYMVTGLHKLTGTHWPQGTAMGIVASDPAFGPAWIAGGPALAMAITWAVLLFQLTFPLAMWWRRTRIPWMLAGVVFHLCTAWWMGIPEMGFAFIAAYAIWLSEAEAKGLGSGLGRYRANSAPAT
jgi:hypothetical protein